MSMSWFPLAILPLVSGCLAFGGGYEIRFDESLRYPVRFSSIEAAGLFHEGLDRANRDHFTEGGGFGILFVFGHGGGVFHETEFYNAQVRAADADRDGNITDEEAAAYHERICGPKTEPR